jgi:raffinose/stachyose/melibiose transport system substrate-binding protein
MRRKISVLVCLLLVASLILSACGTVKSSSNSPKKSTISIIVATGYKDYFENVLLKDMAKKYPEVTVKMTYNSEPTPIIQQQLAAGGGPDIITSQGTTDLLAYARTNHVISLENYAKKYNWMSAFSAWAYAPVSYNQQLYGLPGKLDSEFVYYNKDMFAKNGWEIPKTYEELTSLCDKIQKQNIIPFAFGSSDYKYANEWWWSLAFDSTLSPADLQDLLSGKTPWTSAGPTDAMAKMQNLYAKGYINNKESTAITMDAATQLFSTGKAAMKMEGTWLISNMTTKFKPAFNWDVFVMPSWTDGVEQTLPFALGIALGINSASNNKDAAAEFLNVYADRDNQIAGLNYDGMGIPPIPNVDLSKIKGTAPQVVEMQQLMNQYTAKKATSYLSWTYWGPQTRVYTCENIDALWLGQMDLKSFMNEMQKKSDQDKADGKLFTF